MGRFFCFCFVLCFFFSLECFLLCVLDNEFSYGQTDNISTFPVIYAVVTFLCFMSYFLYFYVVFPLFCIFGCFEQVLHHLLIIRLLLSAFISDSFRSMWYELASALEDFLFSDM